MVRWGTLVHPHFFETVTLRIVVYPFLTCGTLGMSSHQVFKKIWLKIKNLQTIICFYTTKVNFRSITIFSDISSMCSFIKLFEVSMNNLTCLDGKYQSINLFTYERFCRERWKWKKWTWGTLDQIFWGTLVHQSNLPHISFQITVTFIILNIASQTGHHWKRWNVRN